MIPGNTIINWKSPYNSTWLYSKDPMLNMSQEVILQLGNKSTLSMLWKQKNIVTLSDILFILHIANTTAADNLAPCIVRASAAQVLT